MKKQDKKSPADLAMERAERDFAQWRKERAAKKLKKEVDAFIERMGPELTKDLTDQEKEDFYWNSPCDDIPDDVEDEDIEDYLTKKRVK